MTNPVVIDAVAGTSYADFTREFDAPVEAVFRAHADPDLFMRWIGPDSYENRVTAWEFRSGGAYRYEQRDGEGAVYAFRGSFHTVRENDLIIQTFEYEGYPDGVSLDALRFEALPGGRTRLAGHSVFSTIELMEQFLAAGMTDGMEQGYVKLDGLLAE
jgi:uncharacterized protein YndB with AHSA1/START domain